MLFHSTAVRRVGCLAQRRCIARGKEHVASSSVPRASTSVSNADGSSFFNSTRGFSSSWPSACSHQRRGILGQTHAAAAAGGTSTMAALGAFIASLLMVIGGSSARVQTERDQEKDTASQSIEELEQNDWDAFMFKSTVPGEDDDDDDDEDVEDDEEEEGEGDEGGTVSNDKEESLKAWLKKMMVSADAYSAGNLLESFLSEMDKGLAANTKSSLAMIPAYINAQGNLPKNDSVAVIDAGGTNLRICIAKTDENGHVTLESLLSDAMPGKDEEISAEQFYSVLVNALKDRAENEFTKIGFCFSYPAEISPSYDGKLLHWTKEIKIPELVGTYVGKGLTEAFNSIGIKDKKVVVLNDTVACLLAGMEKGQTFNASSYIGFILGTGTNTAYVEKNANITKTLQPQNLTTGSQVINVESGGFSAFERGPLDQKLDEDSENTGSNVFEKCISGEYIGRITLGLLQSLALPNGNFFSDTGAEAIHQMATLQSKHVSNFARGDDDDIGELGSNAFNNDDKDVIRTVFNSVVDRAALFTAVNILAAVVKSGQGKDPDGPICINIDGSTYEYTYQLKEKVQGHLDKMTKERGLHIKCIHVDDAPVVGAAIAGLMTNPLASFTF